MVKSLLPLRHQQSSLVQSYEVSPSTDFFSALYYCPFSTVRNPLPNITDFPRHYELLPRFTGFYLVLLGFTGFYWVLLGFTGFCWVLLSFIGFH